MCENASGLCTHSCEQGVLENGAAQSDLNDQPGRYWATRGPLGPARPWASGPCPHGLLSQRIHRPSGPMMCLLKIRCASTRKLRSCRHAQFDAQIRKCLAPLIGGAVIVVAAAALMVAVVVGMIVAVVRCSKLLLVAIMPRMVVVRAPVGIGMGIVDGC